MRALINAFNRLPKPVRVVIALLLFLTLTLTAGCGAQPAATAPAGSSTAQEVAAAAAPTEAPAIAGATPEEAHTQWLAGMEQQDRQALMPLMAANMPPTRLDAAMSEMWSLIGDEHEDLGAFTGIEDKGIAEEGARRVGFSLWQFANGSRCYRLSLAAEGQGWRAVGWGEAKEGCE